MGSNNDGTVKPFDAAPLLGVWVVVAYRYGMRDAHSYVVGAYSNEDAANAAARGECEYRGGKYGCEVVVCPLADSYVEGVQTPEQSHYVESPYHGMLGDGYHPADLTSNERKQKALVALERRKTPNIRIS